MLVEAMTEKEAVSEITSEFPTLLEYTDKVLDKLFRKDVLKSRVFPIFRRWRWKSRKGNSWTIIYEARNRKEIGDMSRITFYVSANFRSKLVFMPTWTDGKLQFIIYPAHFFQRFSERCEIELSGPDLTDRFFKLNSSYVFETKESIIEKDGEKFKKVEVYGSAKEGVALGLMTECGNILFKTFVTYDMLKGEQVEKFTRNEEIRREIHE